MSRYMRLLCVPPHARVPHKHCDEHQKCTIMKSEWQANIQPQTLTFFLPTSFHRCPVVWLAPLMWSVLPCSAAWGQPAGIRPCGGAASASDCPGRIRLWVRLQAFYCPMVHDSVGTSRGKRAVSEGGRFRIHVCHPWCAALRGLYCTSTRGGGAQYEVTSEVWGRCCFNTTTRSSSLKYVFFHLISWLETILIQLVFTFMLHLTTETHHHCKIITLSFLSLETVF